MGRFTLVIHGGAGTILKSDMTPELEKAYCTALAEGLEAGYGVLEEGGSAQHPWPAGLHRTLSRTRCRAGV